MLARTKEVIWWAEAVFVAILFVCSLLEYAMQRAAGDHGECEYLIRSVHIPLAVCLFICCGVLVSLASALRDVVLIGTATYLDNRILSFQNHKPRCDSAVCWCDAWKGREIVFDQQLQTMGRLQ